ncbi:MAG TPA: hypothetical protein VK499_09905 [Propionibacteriaceae bacterium]|nr:hypothetical protein [Propionibacteriaceae bacterium]
MASQDLLDLLRNLLDRTAVRHGSIEVAKNLPQAPVRPTAKYFTIGLSTVSVCNAPGGMVIDEPGPRSKPSSSTWTIMRPFKT